MNTSVSDLSEQLCDLQSQLAFQEDVVQTLDRIVIQQQQQLDRLDAAVAQLRAQLTDALAWQERQGDEPPPHY